MTRRGNFTGSRPMPRWRCRSTVRRGCCSRPCSRDPAKASERKRPSMSRISIVDLEVFYHIGVTDQERAAPQRLLITVDMEYDFTTAAMSDRLERTINYFDVAQEILKY